MSTSNIYVIPTGIANVASVQAGLRREGEKPVQSTQPEEIRRGDCVILPGVGSFRSGMDFLYKRQLVGPIKERIEENRPTMAICLGLQLLCRESLESPGIGGLGLLPCRVEEFSSSVRVPQFGWNRIYPESDCEYLEPGYAYFANSYRISDCPEGWTCAKTEYGGEFVSALERGNILACQFHPELSGNLGRSLIQRWLDGVLDR